MSLLLPLVSSAETLLVGPGQTFTGIQSAIDAAGPGDTIEVGPGYYPENLVVTKSPLTLVGVRAGVDARGRVAGAPDSAIESVVAPVAGPALTLASGDGSISVSGFSFVASPDGGSAVVNVDSVPLNALVFGENHVQVAGGATGAALRFGVSAVDAILSKNVFVAAGGSVRTVSLDGEHAFHGLQFIHNEILRNGAVANVGLWVDGARNLGPSTARAAEIRGNRFDGHALGFHGGGRSLDRVEITGNIFEGNTGGMSAGPSGALVRANRWSDNTHYGLCLTSDGHAADPDYGARDTLVEDNEFEGNGAVMDPGGYGDVVIDEQAPGHHATNLFRRNRFGSAVAVWNHETGAGVDGSYNFWGADDGPSGLAVGSGGAMLGAAPVSYEPFYADAALSELVFGSSPLEGEVVIAAGQSIGGDGLTVGPTGTLQVLDGGSVTINTLSMQAGSNLVIRRGLVRTGKLDLAPGAVLDVIDGELSLDPVGVGQYHTISGSFTFFNSLGSLNINGDTSFNGSALCLATNIHVAPGVTMFVIGSLILDGCQIDSTGTYNMLVNTGATFEMARCDVYGAFINLVGSDVLLRDNHVRSGLITAFSTVRGARIYHNIFANGAGALNLLPDAVVTTTAEGWGNVDDPSLVINELSLNFRTPVDPSRTLDAGGNLYIQPGDPLAVGLDIGHLSVATQAAEVVLGFSTDYLAYDALVPSSDWPNDLYELVDESAAIGRFNSAVGLSFTHPDPDGTTTDGEIADIAMEARALEGQTRCFFRTKTVDDEPSPDTRLTASSAGVPYLLNFPFTRNSGVLTVDGTVPEFGSEATATQLRDGVPLDVLQSGVLTHAGIVTVTFDAIDVLAGIDDVDVSILATGEAGSVSGILVGTAPIDIDGETLTRYTCELEIGAATPNGVYDLDAIVMDRSGNVATLPIGAIDVSRNRILGAVEPQGLVAAALMRDVEFTATDAGGGSLASWIVPVSFVGGLGTATLAEVPEDTAWLSAKMNWNLRVRLPVTFDPSGEAVVEFTGAASLPGGDLTGDNVVSFGDYNVLRATFPGVGSEADINGDGIVNFGDFNLLRANWLTAGDPF